MKTGFIGIRLISSGFWNGSEKGALRSYFESFVLFVVSASSVPGHMRCK